MSTSKDQRLSTQE